MTIDLTTRKLVMKPVWTPLVGRPVNSHVYRDHVMDIFLGKIIMYVISIRGSMDPTGFLGVPRGSEGSQEVPWVPRGSDTFRWLGGLRTSHVSQDHAMDIFLGKIISYIIWFQGSQGLSRGPKGSKGVPRGSKCLIGREACEFSRVLGPCDGYFPR